MLCLSQSALRRSAFGCRRARGGKVELPRRLVTGNIIPHLSIRCCCRHHGWSRWWQHLWVVRPSVRQPGERGGGRGAARPLETDGCRRTDGRTRGMKTVSSRMDWWREAEGKVSRRARMEGELKSFWRAERMVAPPPQLNTKASATSPPLTPLTPRTLSSAEGFYHISGSGDQVSTCYILVPGSQQHLNHILKRFPPPSFLPSVTLFEK